MILKVLTVPNPKLRIKARPVDYVDNSIKKLMDDMLETMYAHEGCGLAAIQVGVAKRVLVVDVRHKVPNSPIYRIVNPIILERSQETSVIEEGCLSVPQNYAEIKRPASIVMSYTDEHNQYIEAAFDGFLATCLQHEIDHLEGRLFIDYLSPVERDVAIRRVRRETKADETLKRSSG